MITRPHAWIRIVGVGAFAVALAMSIYLLGQRAAGYDFATYLQAADRLSRGDNVYLFSRDAVSVGILREFLYPPVVAAAFLPLLALPEGLAMGLWLGLLCVVAALVGWQLVAPVGPVFRPWAAAGYVLFFPLLWEVSLGNLTLVTLLLCLVGLRLRSRPALSGLAVAGAIGLKLLPLTLLVFLATAGRVRVVVWSMLIGLALLVGTWPVLGDAWRDFFALLASIGTGTPLAGPNIIPLAFGAAGMRFVLPATALCVALVAGVAARREVLPFEYAFALALAAAPLLSSSIRYPYLLLALPLLLSPYVGEFVEEGLRAALVAGRIAVWFAMQAQVWPEAGRSFTLPFYALLVLIAIGLLPLVLNATRGIRPARTLALPI